MATHPTDWSLASWLAELYAELGWKQEAVDKWIRLAEHFGQEGFVDRAVTAYQKILEIDPSHQEAVAMLAELRAWGDRAPVVAGKKLITLGALLLQEKMVTAQQLQAALRHQEMNGGTLGKAAVTLGYVRDEELTNLLSRRYGVPSVNLKRFRVDPAVIKIIPAETARRYQVLPLSRSGATLTIAMRDPTNMDDIKFMTGYNVEPVVASATSLEEAIEQWYGAAGSGKPARTHLTMARSNKVKQDAEWEERAGRLEKAIALCRDIVADNPRDWNTINKIGDLYSRLKRVKEANQEYAKVADFYARAGFLLKAIAVWKQINKLDVSALEPYLNVADLYAKQGLMVEAKGQYQFVVEEYKKRGRIREAGDALKKMADIDPADLKVRSMLVELYIRDGNSAKAVGEHVAIAEELGKKGHMTEARQVLEKGLKIDPKSSKLRLELARIHIVQKNYEKAINYLEDAALQSPSDRQVQVRLGEAYLGAKKVDQAEAIFRRILQTNPEDQEARTQMGRVFLMRGQVDQAEAIFRRILQTNPEDQEARTQMGRVFLMRGQFDQAYEQLVPVVDTLVERKEGERAAGLLQQITQRNPGHVASLVKLVEIYRLLQKHGAVAETCSQLAEAYINLGKVDAAASVMEILSDALRKHSAGS